MVLPVPPQFSPFFHSEMESCLQSGVTVGFGGWSWCVFAQREDVAALSIYTLMYPLHLPSQSSAFGVMHLGASFIYLFSK